MPATRETLRLVVSDHDLHGELKVGEQGMRVLIADQDGLARRMMEHVLHGAGAAAVAGARDGHEALELAHRYRPTVLLIDIALPPAGCVELIRNVRAIEPLARVVTVSAAVDQDESVLAAFRAGATAHIDKDIDPDEFARLVSRAAAGEAIIPGRLATLLLERWRREMPAGGWRPMRSALTTREWQIVELLSAGASTEEITEHLVLSPTTVYSHIYRMLRKLGVHSRRDAVAAAQRLRHVEASMRTPCVAALDAREPVTTPAFSSTRASESSRISWPDADARCAAPSAC